MTLSVMCSPSGFCGHKPDQHCDGRAAENSTVAEKIEAIEVFMQFVMDQCSGNVKEMVASLHLARSTDLKPMQKHMFLVRILVNCVRLTGEVVNKCCFVHWVWGARHNKTVLDKAAGELVGRLVEVRAGIIVYSTEMFQPATPFHARKSLWGMSAHRCRKKVRFTFFSTNVSSLRRGFTSSSQILAAACLLVFHPSCNQLLGTMLGSRCAGEARLHRICRLYKSMPTLQCDFDNLVPIVFRRLCEITQLHLARNG